MTSEIEKNEAEIQGCVSDIQVFIERGRPGEQRQAVILEKDVGILGDRHADGREQQVSILLSEVWEWMKAQKVAGLCFARYKENLRISGLKSELLVPGVHIQIGEAELEILKNKKHCYHECIYILNNKECLLSKGIFYARVVKSGKISVNDRVICMQKNA